jgi:type I restriction enzyme S subunit
MPESQASMSNSAGNDGALEQRGWVRAPLARFLIPSTETVDVDAEQSYPTVGVLNRGRGLLFRDPVAGSSTSYKKLNRIGPGLLVYSRLKAFEGAITVTPDDLLESFASQEFPTFAFAPGVASGFFRILATTQRMWDALQGASKGMGGRRERVKPADFLNIVIDVPPLALQERIVEVIGVIDDQITALRDETEALDRLSLAIAEDLLSSEPTVTLGTMVDDIQGGRSPQADTRPPYADEFGVLKVSAVAPFRFLPEESKALLAGTSMPQSALVQPGDVLMTRANTPLKVGAVARVPADVRNGLYLADKTLRLVPSSNLDPDFLVITMALKPARIHLASSATGTSASMVNVSQDRIRETPIRLPGMDRQQEVASAVLSVRVNADAMRAEAARVQGMRSVLLAGLLDRAIDIEFAELEV